MFCSGSATAACFGCWVAVDKSTMSIPGIIVLAVSHCLVMVLEILKKVLRTMNKNQESFLFKTNMVAPGLLAATIASAVHSDSHMPHGPASANQWNAIVLPTFALW